MDIPFIKKPEEGEDSKEDKKIEFARKSGEDLEKKDPLPDFIDEKKVEDIYDVKNIRGDEEEVAEPIVEKIPEDILEEKKDFFSDFFGKIKNKFLKEKEGRESVIEVNLVKEEIVKYFDWQKGGIILFLALFFSLSLLSVGYWGVSWWADKKQSASNSLYNQRYFQVNKEIKELSSEVEDVLSFKKRLDLSNSLLDGHIYWSNFFDFLENNTLSDVYFSTFSGDISGDYEFNATSNNLDAINAQIKKFLESPYVKNAKVDSTDVAIDDSGKSKISFQLVLLLDPQIFLKNSTSK